MTDNPSAERLSDVLNRMKPKDKVPISATVLSNWITKAADDIGPEATGGRLAWLVASSIAVAAVQRAIDAEGNQLFLLKGGNLLQHRLPGTLRTTKDVDGLVRGDLDVFLAALEDVLSEPWGPLTLRRGPIEIVDVPTKVIKPRRFDIILELRGVTWRRIKFEASPDEAGISCFPEPIPAPALHGFGLPDPDRLIGIALRFQVAQKLHAVSDSHDPPIFINDRARDLPDLLLLRDLSWDTGHPTLAELRQAGVAVFEARAAEAATLGLSPRLWPPVVAVYQHWDDDYKKAATNAGITLTLEEAVAAVNSWITEIDTEILTDTTT